MLQLLADVCNISVEEVELFFKCAMKWLVDAAIWCFITGIILLIIAGLMFLILSVDNKSAVHSKKRIRRVSCIK